MASHPRVNRSVDLEVNLIVWVQLGDYPWWPARIVNREKHEATVELGAEEDDLPVATETNSMVEWFDEEKNISVLENNLICEYTKNMHLVRQESVIVDMGLVVEACRGANKYLESNKAAVASQVRRYKKLEPFEDFFKPKASNLNKKSSADGLRDGGRASRGKGKKKNTSKNSDDDIPSTPPVPRKRKSPASQKSHKKGRKGGNDRSADPIHPMNDSPRKESKNSRPSSKKSQKPKHGKSEEEEVRYDYSGESRKPPVAQSTPRHRDDADPDQSPSTLPRDIADRHTPEPRQLDSDDDQAMSDRSGLRKRNRNDNSDTQKDASGGYESPGSEYKKSKVHQGDHDHANGYDLGMQNSGFNDSESDESNHRRSTDHMDRRTKRGESHYRESRSLESDSTRNSYSSSDHERGSDPRTRDFEPYNADRADDKRYDGDGDDDYESDGTEPDFEVGSVDKKLAGGFDKVSAVNGDILDTRDQELGLEDSTTEAMNQKFETFQIGLLQYNDELLEAEYLRDLYEKRLSAAGKKRERVVADVQELKAVKVTGEMLKATKVHERLNSYMKELKERAPEFVKDMCSLAAHWSTVDGIESPMSVDTEPTADDDTKTRDAAPVPNGVAEKEDIEMKDANEVENKNEGKLKEAEKADNPDMNNSAIKEGEGIVKMGEEEKEAAAESGKEEFPEEGTSAPEVGATTKKSKIGMNENESSDSKTGEKDVPPASEIVPKSSKNMEEIREEEARKEKEREEEERKRKEREERLKNFSSDSNRGALKIFLGKAGEYSAAEIERMISVIHAEICSRSDASVTNSYYNNSVIVIKKMKDPSKLKPLVEQLEKTQNAAHFFD